MAVILDTSNRLKQGKLSKTVSDCGAKALLIPLCVFVVACGDTQQQDHTAEQSLVDNLCTEIWFEKVDRQIASGDGQGHGPDLGSLEWRSVVEFKLGVRGDESLPAADSEHWCAYIDQHFID